MKHKINSHNLVLLATVLARLLGPPLIPASGRAKTVNGTISFFPKVIMAIALFIPLMTNLITN